MALRIGARAELGARGARGTSAHSSAYRSPCSCGSAWSSVRCARMNRPHVAARTGQQAHRWIFPRSAGDVARRAGPPACHGVRAQDRRSLHGLRPTARSPAIVSVTRRSPRATALSSTASPTGAPTNLSVWPSKSRLVRCRPNRRDFSAPSAWRRAILPVTVAADTSAKISLPIQVGEVIDINPSTHSICTVASGAVAIPASQLDPAVCRPVEAGATSPDGSSPDVVTGLVRLRMLHLPKLRRGRPR